MTKWYQAIIIKGINLGKSLGFPTLNLDNPRLLSGYKEGVYAAKVIIDRKEYTGVLYYGPRLILGEKENILEIFVFDFHKEVYGRRISFKVWDFIRQAQNFPDFFSFQKQLRKDCQKAKEILK